MDIDALPPTVRGLLAHEELNLRLVVEGDGARLDGHVPWIHGSDLADPTPFMSEGLVLLTTGTQFARWRDDDARFAAYVGRLAERGLTAVGFGTEVVRDGVPPALAAACDAAGMPLFEVPYGTPFIAVVHANAEAATREEYGRRMWALDAQAAIARAALQPDGLTAIVAELAHQLDAWVGLFDTAGALVRQQPARADDDARVATAGAEAQALIARGARAAASVRVADEVVSMQTIGRSSHLDGVLAVGTGELDHEARSVVTAVVAMAGLALEQNESVRRAWGQLRAGVLRALLEDRSGLGHRIAYDAWRGLPSAPVAVAVAPVPREADHVAWLDRRSDGPGQIFHAVVEGEVVMIVGTAYQGVLEDFAHHFGVGVGVSAEAGYEAIDAALAQARIARDRARPGVTQFADATTGGLLALLARGEGPVVASATLAPLVAYDADHDSDLIHTLRVWLEHDGSHEATARALGVHRHTVRARVERAESVLGVSLEGFPVRAELWAALHISAAAPQSTAPSESRS